MPHQPFSTWVGRWHSMTIAISGPKSNHTRLGTGDGAWILSDKDVH